MQQRNGIEGTISELVRGHGLRRARYKGFAKVDLQNQFIAAACNIKRWFRKLMETAFSAQREQVVLSGAALWRVLANFLVQIDPWTFLVKTPPEAAQSMPNFLSRRDVFDVTL